MLYLKSLISPEKNEYCVIEVGEGSYFWQIGDPDGCYFQHKLSEHKEKSEFNFPERSCL